MIDGGRVGYSKDDIPTLPVFFSQMGIQKSHQLPAQIFGGEYRRDILKEVGIEGGESITV